MLAQGSWGHPSPAKAGLTDETLLLRPSCSDLTAVLRQQPLVHTRGLGFISAWAAHRADGDPAPQLHRRTLTERGHRRNLAVLRANLQRLRKSPVSRCCCNPVAAEPGDWALPSGDRHRLDSHRIQGGRGVEALQDGGSSLQ